MTFRNGIPTSWKQDGYLRKIYLTLVPPDAAAPKIDSAADGVRVLPGSAPVQAGRDQTLFRNDAGTLSVVLRSHTDQSLPAAETTAHELCRVLSGELVLTDAAGVVHRLGAGDHVFVPAGTVIARAARAGSTAYHVLVTA